MSRESSLWSWLAKARRALADDLHMERIENLLGAGTPDVEGFLRTTHRGAGFVLKSTFWLELKSSERPARSSTPIRFKLKGREAQIEFMRRRWELGGNAFWLLQVGSGPDRRLYLAPGDAGAQLLHGVTESELAVLCAHTGNFPKNVSPEAILKRVIECRRLPCLLT